MKKHHIISVCCILFSLSAAAQLTQFSGTVGIEYIREIDNYYFESRMEDSDYTSSSFSVGQPAFAFSWKAGEGKSHTLETLPFSFKHFQEEDIFTIDENRYIYTGKAIRSFKNYFRYIYTWSNHFSVDKGIAYFVGLGATLRSEIEVFRPDISNLFPGSETDLFLNPTISAGLSFALGEKGFFSVYIPYEVIELKLTRLHLDNPNLILADRTNASLNIDWLNRWSIRFGFGVRI